jgi:hypothetical protein
VTQRVQGAAGGVYLPGGGRPQGSWWCSEHIVIVTLRLRGPYFKVAKTQVRRCVVAILQCIKPIIKLTSFPSALARLGHMTPLIYIDIQAFLHDYLPSSHFLLPNHPYLQYTVVLITLSLLGN